MLMCSVTCVLGGTAAPGRAALTSSSAHPSLRLGVQRCRGGGVCGARRGHLAVVADIGGLTPFPRNYRQLVQQAQTATAQCLQDGNTLIEIEFPTLGLDSVPGDSEGASEMSESAVLLRQFCTMFEREDEAAGLRVYFPDAKEMEVQMQPGGSSGKNMFGGEWMTEPTFAGSPFQLDYLTKPNALLELGINTDSQKGKNVTDRVQATDKLFIAAYPSFNVNEMIEVEKICTNAANGRPFITFNGELDRIRSGYYPKFFYPKIGKLAETFIPNFEQAYYIHNFKGTKGGILFRAYPGPWQVLVRPNDDGDTVCVHTQETMPTLKEVALDILPKAGM